VKNVRNILQFAQRQHIKQLDQLTMDKPRDGLLFARIRKPNYDSRQKASAKFTYTTV
jgi:hypothetical protein